MEANFPVGGNMVSGPSYNFSSLQNPAHMHQNFHPNPHPSNPHHSIHPSQISPLQPSDQNKSTVCDHRVKNNSPSEENTDPSLTEEVGNEIYNKSGKKGATWHRMRWTSTMVRLLITAVSYIDEDFTSPMLKKKGKWRLISKVLAERGGSHVSPQQCEDKFNDLNKRYKRLTDILGRGISCKIVENPAHLDYLQNIPEKLKEEARKILSSKHLFYEEMCSYHNCNRVNLPPDPGLRKSLHLALGERDVNGEEGEQTGDDSNGEEEDQEGNNNINNNNMNLVRGMKRSLSGGTHVSVGDRGLIEIREEGLRIQGQMLEIERQRFKWQRFSEKKERELQRMKMENERMKLENDRLELELKKKELELRSWSQ